MLVAALLACAPAPPGPLLFVGEVDGEPRPFRWAEGETTPVEAPALPAWPADPDPRGTHTLLLTADPAGEALWLLPGDGAPPTRLHAAARVRNPAWSPDGAWITVESDHRSYRDLYRLPRDGGPPVRLTAARHGSFEPAVSPDGARLAFGTSRDGNAEIWLADADGQHPRRLTDHRGDDVRPRWRPDGAELAWLSSRDGRPRVWLADPDAPAPRPLRAPTPGEEDVDLAWSPDGERLAVTVRAGAELRVDILDRAGRPVGRLDGPGVDEQPAWSPDGAWLAWSAERDGERDLWVARPDGTHARPLVRREGPDWLPRWGAAAPDAPPP